MKTKTTRQEVWSANAVKRGCDQLLLGSRCVRPKPCNFYVNLCAESDLCELPHRFSRNPLQVIDAMTVLALPGLLALSLLALLLAGLRRVPEGRAYTVHRFGRFVRTLPPGFGFVMPLVERIGQRVSLIGHTVSLGEGAVYYQILDPRQAGADIESVDQLVASTASATLRAGEAGEERSDLQFRQRLNQQLAARGLRVVRCVLPAAQSGHSTRPPRPSRFASRDSPADTCAPAEGAQLL